MLPYDKGNYASQIRPARLFIYLDNHNSQMLFLPCFLLILSVYFFSNMGN